MCRFFLSLACFSFLCPALAQQKQLYILNRGGSNILSVPLDGSSSDLTERFKEGLLAAYDFALDAGTSNLYWTNTISKQILSSDKDGNGAISVGVATVAVPVDLDLDAYNGKIYWADNILKQVYRANLDGGEQEAVMPDSFPDLSSVAVFPAQNRLFFADLDSSTIWVYSLTAASRKVFVKDGLVSPVRLLIDTIQQKLYWADDGQNRIERINLDGTQREVFYQGSAEEYPFGLYLDQETAQLYWTDYGTDRVMRAGLNGFGATPFVTSGLSDPVALMAVTLGKGRPGDRSGTDDPAAQKAAVSVYPNPADNIITFSSVASTQSIERIRVFDELGKQVYVAALSQRSAAVETGLFPEGHYSYSVIIAGQVLYGHFTIAR